MTLFSARPAARSNSKAGHLLVIVLLSCAATAKSEPLSIAVASNFRFTLEALLSEGIKGGARDLPNQCCRLGLTVCPNRKRRAISSIFLSR